MILIFSLYSVLAIAVSKSYLYLKFEAAALITEAAAEDYNYLKDKDIPFESPPGLSHGNCVLKQPVLFFFLKKAVSACL